MCRPLYILSKPPYILSTHILSNKHNIVTNLHFILLYIIKSLKLISFKSLTFNISTKSSSYLILLYLMKATTKCSTVDHIQLNLSSPWLKDAYLTPPWSETFFLILYTTYLPFIISVYMKTVLTTLDSENKSMALFPLGGGKLVLFICHLVFVYTQCIYKKTRLQQIYKMIWILLKFKFPDDPKT